MSLLSRRREELVGQGIDSSRVPPGQYVTDRFPVLHAGVVPEVDVATWDFRVEGLVAEPMTWSWEEFRELSAATETFDIHCVTKWSKLDTTWQGVRVADLMSRVTIDGAASHVVVFAEHGFTANLPLDDFLRPQNLLAWAYDDRPLEPDHGGPLRLVVPHLYFWKSVKWVRGVRLVEGDQPGFWERNGYHMYGDPWREQRYWGD